MKNPNREDVFNALIVDPFAHAIVYALELGYTEQEIEGAMSRAFHHAMDERSARS